VAPTFSIPPPSVSEVMLGASLNLTCVAVGAPMPFVKWKKDPATDLTPDDNLPVGKNVLVLTDIQESANYTCTAASDLGVIETTTMVKVQCSYQGSPFLHLRHRFADLARCVSPSLRYRVSPNSESINRALRVSSRRRALALASSDRFRSRVAITTSLSGN
jgi:hypothetical protein